MEFRILTAAIGMIALFGGTVSAQDTIVQSFSGSGGQNTRPFSVQPGWEIQWDARGSIFQLYLYSEDGNMLGVPANQQGSGRGSSYQAEGGQYYLQVNAIGDWTIDIVQTSDQTSESAGADAETGDDPSIIASFTGSGGRNTRPFTATGPWEIEWNANGDIFQLYLYSADGSMLGVAANQPRL